MARLQYSIAVTALSEVLLRTEYSYFHTSQVLYQTQGLCAQGIACAHFTVLVTGHVLLDEGRLHLLGSGYA